MNEGEKKKKKERGSKEESSLLPLVLQVLSFLEEEEEVPQVPAKVYGCVSVCDDDDVGSEEVCPRGDRF